MDHLNIDLETYSSVPIDRAGAFKYIQSPDFEIMLFSYSFNGAAPVCCDFIQGERLPPWIIEALLDPQCLKHAYNASFEWGCLSKYIGRQLPPEQWRCTMMHGLYAGYTAGLDATGRALGLPEDKRKLNTGKALIRYFCVPCAPTNTNGMRTRNYPHHNPERWHLFKAYNIQDVVTEMEIEKRLAAVPVPESVQKEWESDLIINSRGVAVDMELVNGALYIGNSVKSRLMEEARSISGLNNPNSIGQLSEWLENETGNETESLNKDTVSQLLERDDNSPNVRRMLEIRQELGKTSTKKYDAIEQAVCADGRVRGLLQFYGANRTGRWAGRLVQVQNLPRTYTEPLDLARDLVKQNNADALKCIYGSIPDTLSQLIRTAFIATPGNVLIDADFSAIEARVIAWLAGEEWVLNVFRTTGNIYEETASQLYGVPAELIKKGNPEYELRKYGKAATLALGYQGGTQALITAGHLPEDTPIDQLEDIKVRWRNANKRIVGLWYELENAAVQVISTGNAVTVRGKLLLERILSADGSADYLSIKLPSGRRLYYVSPKVVQKSRGHSIIYMGMDQKTRKWRENETYGGKITENCVQAIARDCLAVVISRLEIEGLQVVFHVHDEVVIEAPEDTASLERVIDIMRCPIPWAPDLPLSAEGWIGKYFKKD
ncbi:MAG: hypothetical protein DBX61_11055 [Clostridiales bacterium]|nr:MAG: hypothetical protein DBX61_11055 [Clostridiales bacterium]